MCLKQRCVSSLIHLFMLSWLQQVMCTISSTGQTVNYYQLRSESHPFSLPDTCNDKNIPYVDWWSYRPVGSLGSWQVPLSQAKVMAAEWCPLSSVNQPGEVMPFPADSVRAEVPPSHFMWHGAGLIPWQGVIRAARGPHAFSRHSAMVLIGPWLHQWFITTVWLWFSLRGVKRRKRRPGGMGVCS